jgi:hypothetical protein
MLFSRITTKNWLSFSLFALCLGVTSSSRAEQQDISVVIAGKLQKAYAGKIIVSAEALPKKIDEELEKVLKEKSKKDGIYILATNEKKAWSLNMMAFLNKDPGDSGVTIVFYDKDNKEAQKNLEPTQSIEINSKKGNKLVSLSSVAISEDAGFTTGKTYIVRVTQLKGNKEVSLAEAQLKLEGEPKGGPELTLEKDPKTK